MSSNAATAILSIDLGAVAANWRAMGQRSTAEAAAVVKADSYGLGMAKVAPVLAAAGCRTFFVATIDEGIALRHLLPAQAIIYVFNGPMAGAGEELLAHNLIPVLNSLEQVEQWSVFAASQGKALRAALHVDTGMSRLGLEPVHVRRLAAEPSLLAGIETCLVLSHMACADEDPHEKNSQQLSAFRELAPLLPKGCPRSLAASSTVFLGPEYHFNLLRPGYGLYGGNPTPGRPNPMAPVVRLMGRILQVRDVDTPMTVGYGATHRFGGKGRIATVAVGYADGYFRAASNRGFGLIEGVRVPVVGRVSMDLTTFDVSAVAPDAARPGAFIELIGPGHDIDDLAAEAGTIGYEVLTALGSRALRVYS